MAATNRYRNVGPVTWTVGSPVTLTGIKSANYDEGNTVLKEGADFDMYPTVGGVVFTDPKVSLEAIDAMALFGTVAGAKGSLAITARDTNNGATTAGGAKLITMSGAFLSIRTQAYQFNQFGTQSLTFEAISVDGQTHPVAITAL